MEISPLPDQRMVHRQSPREVAWIEKGTKRERTYITSENNIRDIISKSKSEVEVIIYFVDKAEIGIEIQDFDTGKILGQLKSSAKQGLNSFSINAKKLEKDKEYRVKINYKGNNGSGSLSNSVKAKYWQKCTAYNKSICKSRAWQWAISYVQASAPIAIGVPARRYKFSCSS